MGDAEHLQHAPSDVGGPMVGDVCGVGFVADKPEQVKNEGAAIGGRYLTAASELVAKACS